MEFEPDQINLKGFYSLVKAVGSMNPPHAKIGVLGKNVSRKGKGSTNSEIGAAHEYGSPKHGLPSRSFLRMPLTNEFPKVLEKSSVMGEHEMKQVLATGSLAPWLKKVAILAVGCCKEAFFTSGWGRWAPWKPGYTNNTGQILMDTTQLRESITEEVVEQ